ncbi:hypothetical protein WJX82_005372 [Trebouxia sp. C0006]
MAALLKEWLVEDLKIKSSCAQLEKDLASGYIFGEVLYKCKLQPDFHQFEDSRAPTAIFNNYRRLQPTLQKLGIQLSKHKVAALTREERDAAAQLLYRIKSALATVKSSIVHGQGLSSNKLAATFGVKTELSKGLLEAQQFRTEREAFNADNQHRFEDALAAVTPRRTAALERMHLQKFQDECIRQSEVAAQGLAESCADTDAGRAIRRQDLLSSLHSTVQHRQERTAQQAATHQALLDRQERLDKEDLRIELNVAAMHKQGKQGVRKAANLEVSVGIDSFESNLQRLTDGGEQVQDDMTQPPAGQTPMEHIQHLRQLAPHKEELQSDSQKYMRTIKAKHHEEEVNRRDRKARRRQALAQQQSKLQDAAIGDEEEQVLALLLSKGAAESALADEMGRLKVQEEIIRAHRLEREADYAAQREIEWEQALAEEAERHRELRAVYEVAHSEQMAAYRSLQQERADARHQKHMAFACDTAWQMVGFAEQAIKYREESDGAKVPKSLYRQWAAMFTAGDPELAAQPAALVTSPQPTVTAADEHAVTEYLGWSGVWQASGPDQATGYNELLADVIAEGATAGASKASPQGAPLQDIPLRLALVGAPFAGKTSMALKLADEHGCKVLNMSELVKEAVAEVDAFDKQGPPSGGEAGSGPAASAEVPIKVQLGRTAQANLQSNGAVSDEVQTQLMVLAIHEVARAIAAQPPALLSTGVKPAGGKPAASKGKKDEPKPVQGYVMDGYPSSVRQAELLEGALTGLDLTAERAFIASASRLAPPRPATLPDLNRPLTSGLDAVVVLELDDEALAVKRALGRRVDPLTGRVYHLEFDVPPPKEPGLAARLKAVAVETNEGGQLTERLARHAQQAPVLNAWLAKFPTLRQGLPAQNSLAEVSTAVDGVAGRILASKAAVTAIKAASAAAQQAQATAESSAVQAGQAQQAAQGAARALLASKRAEIEAADMLEKTKNPKDADPAAAELLKAQSAEKCAAQLKVARAAAADAKAAADAAARAAADASKAVTDAQPGSDLAVCAAAQAAATAAADRAAQSGAAASSAADKAAAAQAAAAVIVADVEQRLQASGQPGPEGGVKALALPPQAPGASSTTDGAGPPAAGPLPAGLGQQMGQQWQAGEATYLAGMAQVFALLRGERNTYPGHYAAVRSVYLTYLQRPAHNKQQKLEDFQKAFNGLDIDLRGSPEARAELLLRCDELQDALWEVCDQRMNDNEAQLRTLKEDTLLKEHAGVVAVAGGQAVQVELDRFSLATSLLTLASRAHWALPCTLAAPNPPDVLGATLPDSIKAKFEKQTGMTFPDWVAPLDAMLPKLATAIRYALAASAMEEERVRPASAQKVKPGGKPAAKKPDPKAAGKGEAEDERAVAAAQEEAVGGVDREVALLHTRLRFLAHHALEMVSDMSEVEQRSWERLAEWMKQRYHAECSAVSAMHRLASQAAFAGQPLPFQLDLQGEELVVDEDAAAIEAEPPRQLAPLPQPPAAPGALSWQQLALLVTAFKAASSSSQILVSEAAELMLKAGTTSQDACFPWQGSSLSSVTGALQNMDPLHTAYLDWHLLAFAVVSDNVADGQANEAQLNRLLAAADASSVAVVKDVLNSRQGASMTFNKFMQQA